jgi:hypothetical protein
MHPTKSHVVDSVLTHVGGPASTGACHNRLPWVEWLLPVVRRHAIRISEAEFARCGSVMTFSLRDDPAGRIIRSHCVQSSGIAREKLSVFIHGAAIDQIV